MQIFMLRRYELFNQKNKLMSNQMSFEEWYEKFKSLMAQEGLAPLEDEEIAVMMHMEELTPEQAVAQCK
jgi:hypothetical protein